MENIKEEKVCLVGEGKRNFKYSDEMCDAIVDDGKSVEAPSIMATEHVDEKDKKLTFEEVVKISDVKNKVSNMKKLRENVFTQILKYVGNETYDEKLVKALQEYTETNKIQEIKDNEIIRIIKKTFTEEEIKELPLCENYRDNLSFLKDYFVYRIQSIKFIEDLDKSEKELEDIIADNNEAFEQIIADHGDVDTYYIKVLYESIEKAPDEATRKKAIMMHDSYVDGFNLTRIKKLYETLSTKNAMRDFKDTVEQKNYHIMKNYDEVCKKYHIESSLIRLGGFERVYLPEKYKKLENLMAFLVIKYIACKKNSIKKADDIMFLLSFTNHYESIMNNKYSDEKKQRFIDNVCEVLDIFM